MRQAVEASRETRAAPPLGKLLPRSFGLGRFAGVRLLEGVLVGSMFAPCTPDLVLQRTWRLVGLPPEESDADRSAPRLKRRESGSFRTA